MFEKFYDNCSVELVWRRNVLAFAKALIVDICDDFISSSTAVTEDNQHVFNLLQVFEHIFGRKLRENDSLVKETRPSRSFTGVLASNSFFNLSGLTSERCDPYTIVESCRGDCASDSYNKVFDKAWEIAGDTPSRIEKFRIWFLISLEERKLEECFNEILQARDKIKAIYLDDAFLPSDEASILHGFLPSLRCVDFAICLKGAKLDYPFIALDFSPYLSTRSLRRAITNQKTDDQEGPDVDSSHLAALLDQKTYLEEVNSRLSERNKVLEAQLISDTTSVREEVERELETTKAIHSLTKQSLEEQLKSAENRAREAEAARLQLEREKAAEVSARKERELSTDVLERDLQLKQELIASLRDQIADLKCRLNKNVDLEKNLANIEQAKAVLSEQVESREKRIQDGENNVRIEREWRLQLQKTLENERLKVSALQNELEHLRQRCNDAEQRCSEQEITLSDMANQLQDYRLRIDQFEEEIAGRQGAQWIDDKEVKQCINCQLNFSVSRRRHHCRSCGGVFCDDCSSKRLQLPSSPKPVRVCDACFQSNFKQ